MPLREAGGTLAEFLEVETEMSLYSIQKRPERLRVQDLRWSQGAMPLLARPACMGRNMHFVSCLIESDADFAAA